MEIEINNEVITRLRSSKAHAENKWQEEGKKSGRRWAARDAEYDELDNLWRAYDPQDGWNFVQDDAAAYQFFGIIHPGYEDKTEAEKFWEHLEAWMPNWIFVENFAAAALEVFEEVRGKL
jgi:hypothetical protein